MAHSRANGSTLSHSLSPRIAVIGATSAIAEHCVRLWLQAGPADVVLVGRSMGRLQRVASDLAVRAPTAHIECLVTDLCDTHAIEKAVWDLCATQTPSTVLIAHGALPQQTACEESLHRCRTALEVNAVSPALWLEAFVARMEHGPSARLVVIGSVAGDRGRQSNYVYGAAKGLLERYTQGLQHRLALRASALKVVLVKPGPTATPMTMHLTAQGQKLASVESVAKAIVDGTAKGSAVIYAPGKWRLVMLIIRNLPTAIFHRLKI